MITGDGPKTIRELIEAHKTLTHEDLISDPNVQGICYFLGAALGNQDAADVAIAIASIFGSLCFDAEMQHALQTEPDRNDMAATFEERLELFSVHARIAYDNIKAFAAKEQVYHGKQGAH